MRLGGELGRNRGWGDGLAVSITDGSGLQKLRSRIGNELAMASSSQGLQVRSRLSSYLGELHASVMHHSYRHSCIVLADLCTHRLQPIGIVAYRESGMNNPSEIKLSLRGHGDKTDTTPISQVNRIKMLASCCIGCSFLVLMPLDRSLIVVNWMDMQEFGGGGHRLASSCIVSAEHFDCWKIES